MRLRFACMFAYSPGFFMLTLPSSAGLVKPRVWVFGCFWKLLGLAGGPGAVRFTAFGIFTAGLDLSCNRRL